MAKSFFNPGTAAAFTIGESSGVVVENGRLKIKSDEFNFPKMTKKNIQGNFWHRFNSWFDSENGVFKVSPKNRQKIEIDLGPIDQIEKYVKQLENKKDKKVK